MTLDARTKSRMMRYSRQTPPRIPHVLIMADGTRRRKIYSTEGRALEAARYYPGSRAVPQQEARQ